MRYCVVIVDDRFESKAAISLEREVTMLCDKGWRPQGGVSISKYEVGYENYVSMAQAMVKD